MTAVAFVDDNEKKRRSWPVVVAVSAVVGLIAAGLAWLAHSWFATGPQPSEALPASTLAYVSLDLDPAGEQKMEALDALGKFPELGADDVRRDAFKVVTADAGCDLEFEDVEDWLGHRVAFAMVDLDKPEPVMVLQLDGDEGLSKGLKAVGECIGEDYGSAHDGDWAVIARSEKVAERVLADAAEEPLSEDADFRKWTGKAGEPGIATLYVSPKAGDAVLEAMEEDPELAFFLSMVPTTLDPGGFAGPAGIGFFALTAIPEPDYEEEAGSAEPFPAEPGDVLYPGMPGCPEPEQPDFENMTEAEVDAWFEEHDPQYRICIVEQDGTVRQMTPAEERAEERRQRREMERWEKGHPDDEEELEGDFGWEPQISDSVLKSLADFSGLGGVLRFEDGALELEIVGDRIAGSTADLTDGDRADARIGDLPVGAAVVYGLSTADALGSRLTELLSASMGYGFMEDPVKEFESSTGLTMEDFDALGGGSVTVVVGDPQSLEQGPAELELAVLLDGDAGSIEASLERLQRKALEPLTWQRDGDVVVAGINPAYVAEVVDGEGLAGSDRYREVVPGGGDASMVFFVDFDRDDWLVEVAPKGERDDVRPLDSLGISRTTEDGLDHTTLRLTLE